MRPPRSSIDELGISTGYVRADGEWQMVSPRVRAAIRASMRADPVQTSSPEAALRVVEPGDDLRLKEPAELILEDGATVHCQSRLPADLPFGYHILKSANEGKSTRLFVSPGSCFLPKSLRAWGWAIQLYALRSKHSWGMGDFGDLAKFCRWSAEELDCDFILTNPLGAASPLLPQQASPYYPSSRSFLNPLYIRVENIPGIRKHGRSFRKLAASGIALNDERLINRDAVFRLKMAAFGQLWKYSRHQPQFISFQKNGGKSLLDFATFCALAQRFQSGWRKWPAQFHHPDSPAVRKFQREHASEIAFHQWLQWQADRQLAKAASTMPLLTDVPVGVDPEGADAWIWQDALAKDVSVGAPPDAFNTQGQDWGLPPFIPHRLRASGYEPFRQMIRTALRHGRGLRIDHVMGLSRLFWIPKNTPAKDGAFVYYPFKEMLAILAIESHRAKALVVGEDLGTVDPQVRVKLRRRKILSYRLLWFENQPLKKYPVHALSAVSTHDLFTIPGLWSGSDFVAQKKIGLRPSQSDTNALLQRLKRRLRLKNAPASKAVMATYKLLSQAPSNLLTASLDDALEVEERPNMPGTTTAWPNWSLALPVPLESIYKKPLVKQIAKVLKRQRKK